jgi:hypothetical protein
MVLPTTTPQCFVLLVLLTTNPGRTLLASRVPGLDKAQFQRFSVFGRETVVFTRHSDACIRKLARPTVCGCRKFGAGSGNSGRAWGARQVRAASFGKKAEMKKPGRMTGLSSLVRPKRFELLTPWFVAKYSIQLSYGRFEGCALYAVFA